MTPCCCDILYFYSIISISVPSGADRGAEPLQTVTSAALSACQARIRCSWRHPFPSLLAEAVLLDHKSHLNLFTWPSSLWHQHAWTQASWIQMCSLQTGGDLRVRATEQCARFLLPMASIELMYLSFSHLSCLSNYKHHHLCLTDRKSVV